MVRTFLVSTVGASLLMSGLVTPASAQAPRLAAAPAFTWSGFYVGASAGYLQRDNDILTTGTPAFGSATLAGGTISNTIAAQAFTGRANVGSGFIAGGQIGYNWRFGGVVLGVEADIQSQGRNSSDDRSVNLPVPGFPNQPVAGSVTARSRFDYLGTVRGRIGYLVYENLLIFGTGGFAYGHRDETVTFSFFNPNSVVLPFGGQLGRSKMMDGYTVGGGLEYALSENWSVKAEGLYYDLGRTRSSAVVNDFVTSGALFTQTNASSRSDERGYLARVGVNYKFNWF